MASQPPSRTRQQQQTEQRSQSSSPPPQSQNLPEMQTLPVADAGVRVRAGKAPGLKLEEAKATAGTAGERNLNIEKFNGWVGNNLPCGFRVRTLPENGLELVLEQLVYKKTYNGKGFIETSLVPVAPIGTKGKLIARDTTTGETLEQPWTWHLLNGGGGGLGLWGIIKKLFVKSDG
jgi:hypothetical protein